MSLKNRKNIFENSRKCLKSHEYILQISWKFIKNSWKISKILIFQVDADISPDAGSKEDSWDPPSAPADLAAYSVPASAAAAPTAADPAALAALARTAVDAAETEVDAAAQRAGQVQAAAPRRKAADAAAAVAGDQEGGKGGRKRTGADGSDDETSSRSDLLPKGTKCQK